MYVGRFMKKLRMGGWAFPLSHTYTITFIPYNTVNFISTVLITIGWLFLPLPFNNLFGVRSFSVWQRGSVMVRRGTVWCVVAQ
jgi:hypothetical protein